MTGFARLNKKDRINAASCATTHSAAPSLGANRRAGRIPTITPVNNTALSAKTNTRTSGWGPPDTGSRNRGLAARAI